MEISYIRKSDYLCPNLALDPADQVDVGKDGQMRRRYLHFVRVAAISNPPWPIVGK